MNKEKLYQRLDFAVFLYMEALDSGDAVSQKYAEEEITRVQKELGL